MKTKPVLFQLSFALVILVFENATAQTFKNLYNFTAPRGSFLTNSEGYGPASSLILSGNMLFGTASSGGTSGAGTLFSMDLGSMHLTNLHSFGGSASSLGAPNHDGANPLAGLVIQDNTLYGTASYGGSAGEGTLFTFKIKPLLLSLLHNFTQAYANGNPNTFVNNDGGIPEAPLMLSGNLLYGTASTSGAYGNGTLFAINTDGTGFRTLHSFSSTTGSASTNTDGIAPYGGLAMSSSSDVLFGVGFAGGSAGKGTVFSIGTNGSNFITLHNFAATTGNTATNADGSNPWSGLLLVGDFLYGTTILGGNFGVGTVFSIKVDGTQFANLHSFSSIDGASPYGGLVLSTSGYTLYGTTIHGGISTNGVVYSINVDGTGFSVLHSFSATSVAPSINEDGATPYGGLVLSASGDTLYGAAGGGGTSGGGTIFGITLPPANPPSLSIVSSGSNVNLLWPIDAVGYGLQSSANLGTSNWNQISSIPVITNGQKSVILPITTSQTYYRLSR